MGGNSSKVVTYDPKNSKSINALGLQGLKPIQHREPTPQPFINFLQDFVQCNPGKTNLPNRDKKVKESDLRSEFQFYYNILAKHVPTPSSVIFQPWMLSNTPDGDTALTYAIKHHCSVNKLHWLSTLHPHLTRTWSCRPAAKSHPQFSPIVIAIRSGCDIFVLLWLLDNYVSLNGRDAHGYSILHHVLQANAVVPTNPSYLRLLLNAIQTYFQETKQEDAQQEFLTYVNQGSTTGGTPILIATMEKATSSIFRLLCQYGANLCPQYDSSFILRFRPVNSLLPDSGFQSNPLGTAIHTLSNYENVVYFLASGLPIPITLFLSASYTPLIRWFQALPFFQNAAFFSLTEALLDHPHPLIANFFRDSFELRYSTALQNQTPSTKATIESQLCLSSYYHRTTLYNLGLCPFDLWQNPELILYLVNWQLFHQLSYSTPSYHYFCTPPLPIPSKLQVTRSTDQRSITTIILPTPHGSVTEVRTLTSSPIIEEKINFLPDPGIQFEQPSLPVKRLPANSQIKLKKTIPIPTNFQNVAGPHQTPLTHPNFDRNYFDMYQNYYYSLQLHQILELWSPLSKEKYTDNPITSSLLQKPSLTNKPTQPTHQHVNNVHSVNSAGFGYADQIARPSHEVNYSSAMDQFSYSVHNVWDLNNIQWDESGLYYCPRDSLENEHSMLIVNFDSNKQPSPPLKQHLAMAPTNHHSHLLRPNLPQTLLEVYFQTQIIPPPFLQPINPVSQLIEQKQNFLSHLGVKPRTQFLSASFIDIFRVSNPFSYARQFSSTENEQYQLLHSAQMAMDFSPGSPSPLWNIEILQSHKLLSLSEIDFISILTSGARFHNPLAFFNTYLYNVNPTNINEKYPPPLIVPPFHSPLPNCTVQNPAPQLRFLGNHLLCDWFSRPSLLTPSHRHTYGLVYNFRPEMPPGLIWYTLLYAPINLDEFMTLLATCRSDLTNHLYMTPLMYSFLRQTPYECLVYMIRSSLNLNQQDVYGRTALHYWAISAGFHTYLTSEHKQSGGVDLLYETIWQSGSFIDILDVYHQSPLSYALYNRCPDDVLNLLLDLTVSYTPSQLSLESCVDISRFFGHHHGITAEKLKAKEKWDTIFATTKGQVLAEQYIQYIDECSPDDSFKLSTDSALAPIRQYLQYLPASILASHCNSSFSMNDQNDLSSISQPLPSIPTVNLYNPLFPPLQDQPSPSSLTSPSFSPSSPSKFSFNKLFKFSEDETRLENKPVLSPQLSQRISPATWNGSLIKSWSFTRGNKILTNFSNLFAPIYNNDFELPLPFVFRARSYISGDSTGTTPLWDYLQLNHRPRAESPYGSGAWRFFNGMMHLVSTQSKLTIFDLLLRIAPPSQPMQHHSRKKDFTSLPNGPIPSTPPLDETYQQKAARLEIIQGFSPDYNHVFIHYFALCLLSFRLLYYIIPSHSSFDASLPVSVKDTAHDQNYLPNPTNERQRILNEFVHTNVYNFIHLLSTLKRVKCAFNKLPFFTHETLWNSGVEKKLQDASCIDAVNEPQINSSQQNVLVMSTHCLGSTYIDKEFNISSLLSISAKLQKKLRSQHFADTDLIDLDDIQHEKVTWLDIINNWFLPLTVGLVLETTEHENVNAFLLDPKNEAAALPWTDSTPSKKSSLNMRSQATLRVQNCMPDALHYANIWFLDILLSSSNSSELM